MLKVGIIGCGKIAQVRHAPEYLENPNCSLEAFYDVDFERARRFAEEFGGKAYASMEELLAADLDAVSICTANIYHAQGAVAALKAGKHVLCEKPMAMNLEDCELMARTAREQGKILMIGQNQRMASAHVERKRILDSGEVGKLITFQTSFRHPGPEGWTGQKNSWFFDKKIAAFGAMADLGIHKTDLLIYLTGQKVVKTFARLETLDKKYPDGTPVSVDDNAICTYVLENGALGTMTVSWTNYGTEDNSTRLYCTEGVIRMYDDPEASLIVEKRDGTVERFALDQLTSNKDQTGGKRTSTGVIDAFVDSLMNGKPSPISGESVIPAMKAVFANERSAKEGRMVDVE